MSYLDGGQGPRVPTAQTFLPSPSQSSPQAPEQAARDETTFEAKTSPPTPLEALLQSLAVAVRHEVDRLTALAERHNGWEEACCELGDRLDNLSGELFQAVAALQAFHSPSVLPPPAREV